MAASGGFLSSPRRRRRLAWGSGIVSFVGGVVAVALLWPDVERTPETMSNEPAVVVTTPRNVVLTKEARAATIDAANVFLETAVKRDHPERAWDVVHPTLREGYTKASAINFAEGLKGNLLIVHGSGDDNVHYQGTELLVNRLIELGKPFDFMTYHDRTHAIAEGPGTSAHVYHLLARYLTSHLPAGARDPASNGR